MKNNTRMYSDSAIGDFISKAVDRVSNFAADNPKKTLVITTIAPALAFLIFKIAGQYIDAAREIKKINSGQFDELQFVENYKKEFNAFVERAKLDLVKKLGPDGRDPKIIRQYLDDILEDQSKINRCRTVRELSNAGGEIKLKRIADALDAYKSQKNLKDSSRLLGAVRLMNARLPGATFCSRRYGDGINMRHYDRRYADGVIETAKEKIKKAIAKVKQFGNANPRLVKALASMLVILGAGSAAYLASANKVESAFKAAFSEPYNEKINSNTTYEDPGAELRNWKRWDEAIKASKESFAWFKKAGEVFKGKKRYNPYETSGPKDTDIVIDSLYGMRKAHIDRCFRDNVIAVAKEKTKAALSKAKQLAGKYPRLTKALGIMLAALATGSAIAISKAKKQVQPVFEEIGPLAVKQPSMSQPLKEAFGWFNKAESVFDESAKRFSGKKDSAFSKKKIHIDGLLDSAKQKIKSLIDKIKKFKSSYPNLFRALELLLAAVAAGSILGITKYILGVKQAEKRDLEFARLESLKGNVEVMGQDEIDAMDNKDIESALNAHQKNKPYYYYAGKKQEVINRFRQQNPKRARMTKTEYDRSMKAAQILDIVKQILYEAIRVKELLKSKIKSKIGISAEQKPFKIQSRESDIITTMGPKRKPPLALTHDNMPFMDDESRKRAIAMGLAYTAPAYVANAIITKALHTDFFVKKVDGFAKKLSLFANKHPMIAKLVRVLLKIFDLLLKIRRTVNDIVLASYFSSICLFGKEGIDILNKLFGIGVETISDVREFEVTNRNLLGMLLTGVRETLIAMVRLFGKFVSTQMKPSNAV